MNLGKGKAICILLVKSFRKKKVHWPTCGGAPLKHPRPQAHTLTELLKQTGTRVKCGAGGRS